MHLTVAICTHNRCVSLHRTLESLTRLRIPPDVTWEVLVVNNGSSDATAETIAAFAQVLPLRVIDEAKLGKSNAANAAVHAATGAYMLWTDDDVIVNPEWLAAHHAAFLRWPDASFFGGPVEPRFEGHAPVWLEGALPHIGNVYAAVDYGPDTVVLEGETLPYGANMVVRTADQRRHLYDPRLGRRGTLLLAGEEWAVFGALLEEGATGRWVPAARVQHVIPPDRQTLRYVRNYYVGNGSSYAAVHSADVKMLWGHPRWLWRELLLHQLLYRVCRLTASSSVWSLHLKRASVAWGMLHPDKLP